MSADDGGVRDNQAVPKVSLETSFGEDGRLEIWKTNIHFKEEGGRDFGVLYFRTLEAAKESGLTSLGPFVQRAILSKKYRLDSTGKRVFDFVFPKGEVPSAKIPYACVVYDEEWRIGKPGFEDAFLFKTQWYQLSVPVAFPKPAAHKHLVSRPQ
jgi:hypothetical protein